MRKEPVPRSPYRSRMDIVAEILKIATPGAKKTQIMYGANLSYKLLNAYIDHLTKEGSLALQGDRYYTTEKGKIFLENYGKLAQPETGIEIERKLKGKPLTTEFIETYRKLIKP